MEGCVIWRVDRTPKRNSKNSCERIGPKSKLHQYVFSLPVIMLLALWFPFSTGVWPESESFRDEGMAPIPSKWKGICQFKEEGLQCNRYVYFPLHVNFLLCSWKLSTATHIADERNLVHPSIGPTFDTSGWQQGDYFFQEMARVIWWDQFSFSGPCWSKRTIRRKPFRLNINT